MMKGTANLGSDLRIALLESSNSDLIKGVRKIPKLQGKTPQTED